MTLRLVGCSHHCSSVQVREQMAFAPEQIPDALERFRRQFPGLESVLLSTCNRVELYVAGERELLPPCEQLAAFLAAYHQVDPQLLCNELYCHDDQEAVRHLFLVAASLDSMVLGEAQILSQVKQAFSVAQDLGVIGPIMHHAFEAAFRVAKRVASDTEINRRRVSIPSIAVADYAKQLFETLDDKKILVIGAGEMGEETLRYLRAEGARQIVVLNRSRERAERMAEMFQAEVDDWLQLQARVAWADLIVSTTGAHEPLVTEQQFREIQQSRSERPLFILDLAVPRDFHPGIAQFTNVYLYSIDDLRSVCEANRKAREKHWPKADRIVREETTRFIAERNHRATAPTIQRLKQRAEELKQLELARLLHKLGPVDPQVQQEIEQSFDRLVNKLLHSPLQSLRGEAEKGSPQGLLSALRHLFQISD